MTLTAVACVVYASYYGILVSAFPLAERGLAPPLVLEWTGTALCASTAIALTWWRRAAA